jgi:hypothetical protein
LGVETRPPVASRVVRAAAAVAVLLLVAGVVYVVRANPYRLDEFASPRVAELADGLKVADGSVVLGPIFPIPVYEFNDSPGWFAILAVTDQPLRVFSAYLEQFRAAVPSASDQFDEPRCRPGGASAFMCSAGGTGVGPDGELLSINAQMSSNPDDPTGRFVIVLTVIHPKDRPFSSLSYPYPFLGEKAPEPHHPRRPPRAGGLLAKRSIADNRYVLLKGSRLAAVTGDVSGFGVLLKVDPGADIDRVAPAYAAQTTNTPIHPPVRVERFGATTTLTRVPGVGGGNDAEVWAVDQPGRSSDYLFYRVSRG